LNFDTCNFLETNDRGAKKKTGSSGGVKNIKWGYQRKVGEEPQLDAGGGWGHIPRMIRLVLGGTLQKKYLDRQKEVSHTKNKPRGRSKAWVPFPWGGAVVVITLIMGRGEAIQG